MRPAAVVGVLTAAWLSFRMGDLMGRWSAGGPQQTSQASSDARVGEPSQAGFWRTAPWVRMHRAVLSLTYHVSRALDWQLQQPH